MHDCVTLAVWPSSGPGPAVQGPEPSWEREASSARSALQAGVLRVDVAAEQSPVEGVHLRGGRCVPGQDRGHNWRYVIWDVTRGALEYVLVAGDWAAAVRHRYPADVCHQPVDQSHGGVAGGMSGVAFGDVALGGRQVEMRRSNQPEVTEVDPLPVGTHVAE